MIRSDPGAFVLDPSSVQRGPGRRLPETLAVLAERDRLLVEAATRHLAHLSNAAAAKHLHRALCRYREGAWQRDRVAIECPARHLGKFNAVLWAILKLRDHVPSERTIRRACGRSEKFEFVANLFGDVVPQRN
ncbi:MULTISPECIES: hypothetical protein [unclassified Bradyrhizobium]